MGAAEEAAASEAPGVMEEAAASGAPATAVSENTGTVRNTIRRHSTGTEAAVINLFLILFIRMVLIKKQIG